MPAQQKSDKQLELLEVPSSRASESENSKKLYRYGFCYRSPDCLQFLNRIGFIVFFISISHCLQNASNGVLGVTISTLEKRFSFTSFQSSLMASFYEVGQVPAVIFVMFYGNRVNRPRWMGAGMLLVLAGCMIMILPKWIAPAYDPIITSSVETTDMFDVCSNDKDRTLQTCPTNHPALSNYLLFFILGRFLIGVGATPILTIGITYIHDCTNIHGFALYSGIYNAMSIIGPGVGLVSASIFLKLYEDGSLAAERLGLEASDPAWVGNWWLSYLLLAGLILISVFPLFGYSDKRLEDNSSENKSPIENENKIGNTDIEIKSLLDKTAQKQELQKTLVMENKPIDSGKLEAEENNVSIHITNIVLEDKMSSPLKTVFKVFRNPIFMLACLFNSTDMFIIMGFNAFGPKVFENFLSLSPTTAGLLFGAVLLPAGAIGTIFGGVIIKSYKMSIKGIIKLQMILAVVVLSMLPIILLNCADNKFAGVNFKASEDQQEFSVNSVCSKGCSCEHIPYQAVCTSTKVQYYSACHAGCVEKLFDSDSKQIHFSNCSCLFSNTTSSSSVNSIEVSSGVCERDFCFLAYIFLPLFACVVFIVFMCFTLNTSLLFRAVEINETTAAVSIQILTTKLLGSIPGPIMFGLAFDLSCGLYNTNRCSSNVSTCLFIRTANASKNILFLCAFVKIINTCAMLIMFYIRKKKARKINLNQ